MIKTKSIHDPVEESDGERILVSRYWPHDYSREQLQLTDWFWALGPDGDTLYSWKKGKISWNEYTQQYLEEMKSRTGLIARLAKRAQEGTITLLCYEEEDDPHCHRHLLKGLIEAVEMETK